MSLCIQPFFTCISAHLRKNPSLTSWSNFRRAPFPCYQRCIASSCTKRMQNFPGRWRCHETRKTSDGSLRIEKTTGKLNLNWETKILRPDASWKNLKVCITPFCEVTPGRAYRLAAGRFQRGGNPLFSSDRFEGNQTVLFCKKNHAEFHDQCMFFM